MFPFDATLARNHFQASDCAKTTKTVSNTTNITHLDFKCKGMRNEIISEGQNWSDHKVWKSQSKWPLFIYVHEELILATYFLFLFHVHCHWIYVPLCVCHPIPILTILPFTTASQVPINHKHWHTTVVEGHRYTERSKEITCKQNSWRQLNSMNLHKNQ